MDIITITGDNVVGTFPITEHMSLYINLGGGNGNTGNGGIMDGGTGPFSRSPLPPEIGCGGSGVFLDAGYSTALIVAGGASTGSWYSYEDENGGPNYFYKFKSLW